ncbi:hypothetical protein [Arthrobacter sp. NEB 688]|uniref:hypothetical protein n=1 Tax=Arthrobacter sp. NEB 688 TaxID=904039 RepID=UPI001563A864|nr:hypothetical protein [Arthrobacter sp. NEB 688]QKE82975.1 hypothetical protein HL663_02740 [Arthrobacter sp. NEB 688]
MRAARALLGVVGLAALAWGLLLVSDLGPQVVDVLVWVVGGILAHDAVLAPVVVGLGALLGLAAPAWMRPPLVRLLVVLGPLTLVAVPVLGRYGARPDNPTLLDRPYRTGWLVIAAVAVLLTVVGAVRARRAQPVDEIEPRP